MPEFYTSCISVQVFKFHKMFPKSPFHKEIPAEQNTKLPFVQGKLGVRLSYSYCQPALRMLRHTIYNRHVLVMSNFTWFPSLKFYHKKVGLRLAEASLVVFSCVKAVPLVNSFSWCFLFLTTLHNGSSVDGGLCFLLYWWALISLLLDRVLNWNISLYVSRGHLFWEKTYLSCCKSLFQDLLEMPAISNLSFLSN